MPVKNIFLNLCVCFIIIILFIKKFNSHFFPIHNWSTSIEHEFEKTPQEQKIFLMDINIFKMLFIFLKASVNRHNLACFGIYLIHQFCTGYTFD